MQIKTVLRFHLTPEQMSAIQKSTNNKCWRGSGKKGTLPFPLLVGVQTRAATMEIDMEIPLNKLGLEVPFNLAITLVGIFPPKLKISCHSDICALMFLAAQFVIGKSWKQPKCPSTAE